MRSKKITRLCSALLSLLALFSLIPVQTAHAANNTIYVTPPTQTVKTGDTFTVAVKGKLSGNWLSGASGVNGTLTFPVNLLQVASASTSGSSFSYAPSSTVNNPGGTVAFSGQTLGAIDDRDVHILNVTFRAIANGTATVGFSSGSYRSVFGRLSTALTSGTYTITTPPATCPAGQIGTPPNCSTPPAPNPSPSPTPTAPSIPVTPTPPSIPEQPIVTPEAIIDEMTAEPEEIEFSISDVTTSRSYTSASLIWRTSTISTATVTYGTSLKSLDKKAETTRQADESYEATFKDLVAGKQYYYSIAATSDKDTTKTDTYSGIFTTRGYPIVISVTQDKEPAPNAKLTIGEQNYSTDKSGRVSLELASGSYQLEAKTKDGSKKFTLAVAKKEIPSSGGSVETQRFTYDIAATTAPAQSNTIMLLIIGLGIGALLLFGFLFWLWRRRQNQDAQPSVIISDQDYSSWTPPQPASDAAPAYTATIPEDFPPYADANEPAIPPEQQSIAMTPDEQDVYQTSQQGVESYIPEQPPLETTEQQFIQQDTEPLAPAPADDLVSPTNLQDILPPQDISNDVAPQEVFAAPPAEQQPFAEAAAPATEQPSVSEASYQAPSDEFTAPAQEEQTKPFNTPPTQDEPSEPESELVQTVSGAELQINHRA